MAYKYHVFQDPCYHPECVEIYTMVYHDPVIRSFEHFKDYYEAATVDGATGLQQFWYITLPSLKNILFFCSVTLTVDMWKLFNESYILPGPGTSNTSLFQYMYESGFNVFNMGYASAIGVVLILILIVISVIQFIVRHKQGEI